MQTVISLIVLLFFIGCGDNAFDGTNLIESSQRSSSAFEALQKNVLLHDANASLQSAKRTLIKLESKDIEGAKSEFKELMKDLKGVDSLYIIKDFNESMTTLRDYNDVFHTRSIDAIELSLNQFLKVDINDSAILSENVKNINGLEYILFDENITSRKLLAASYVVEKMKERLENIVTWYATTSLFYANNQTATDSLLNILIDSSNKLSEWRLGDAASLTNQYKGQVIDYKRLEYVKSALSLEAIIAILEAHQRVMNASEYEDFGDFAMQNNASNEVQLIRESISNALTLARAIETPLESNSVLASEQVKKLYEALRTLHFAYYESLINALNLTAKIIEADGD